MRSGRVHRCRLHCRERKSRHRAAGVTGTLPSADLRGFYLALGVELPGWAAREAPAGCFANPGAHAHGDRDPSCSVNLESGACRAPPTPSGHDRGRARSAKRRAARHRGCGWGRSPGRAPTHTRARAGSRETTRAAARRGAPEAATPARPAVCGPPRATAHRRPARCGRARLAGAPPPAPSGGWEGTDGGAPALQSGEWSGRGRSSARSCRAPRGRARAPRHMRRRRRRTPSSAGGWG